MIMGLKRMTGTGAWHSAIRRTVARGGPPNAPIPRGSFTSNVTRTCERLAEPVYRRVCRHLCGAAL